MGLVLGLQLISACVFGLESAKMIGLPPAPLASCLGCGVGVRVRVPVRDRDRVGIGAG